VVKQKPKSMMVSPQRWSSRQRNSAHLRARHVDRAQAKAQITEMGEFLERHVMVLEERVAQAAREDGIEVVLPEVWHPMPDMISN